MIKVKYIEEIVIIYIFKILIDLIFKNFKKEMKKWFEIWKDDNNELNISLENWMNIKERKIEGFEISIKENIEI